MIATLIALILLASPPDEPKPPTADRAITKPGPSPTAKAEAARKKQERNRLRALNSRRLAGMDGSDSNSSQRSGPGGFGHSGGPNPGGFGNPGVSLAGATGYENLGSTMYGGGYGALAVDRPTRA